MLSCFRANPKSNKLAVGRKKFNMDPKKVRIAFMLFSVFLSECVQWITMPIWMHLDKSAPERWTVLDFSKANDAVALAWAGPYWWIFMKFEEQIDFGWQKSSLKFGSDLECILDILPENECGKTSYNTWLDLTWFIQHPWCIGPHVDAMSVCLEPMLQPLSRLIPFFVDPCSLYLSSLSLVDQVFSWILQLPIVRLASECMLHPFLWHNLAIVVFFPGSHSPEAFFLFFSVSPRLWLYPSSWYQEYLSATCGGLLPVSCSM